MRQGQEPIIEDRPREIKRKSEIIEKSRDITRHNDALKFIFSATGGEPSHRVPRGRSSGVHPVDRTTKDAGQDRPPKP
jgi:hypothetical protein